MRFIIFAPEQHLPLAEGIQKSAALSIDALRGAGHECLVVSQQSYGTPFIDRQNPERLLSANPNRFAKYLSWIRSGWTLSRDANTYDKAVFFSLDWSFIAALLLFRLRARRLPITVAIFGTRECKGLGKLALRLSKHSIHVWCASPRVRELATKAGIAPERIILMPVFFTESLMTTSDTPRIPGSIAYLSSADAHAGLATMIAVANSFPDRQCTIAIRKFSEREEAGIQDAIRNMESLNLPNLSIKRTIPDMAAFLASTETVILPPSSEDATMAVPLVALEAAHAGCRVYMRSLPVFGGLFATGLAIPFNDNTELIDALTSARTTTNNVFVFAKSPSTFIQVLTS